MATIQREEIEKLLKPNQVIVDTQTIEIAKDKDNNPVFETVFIKPPNSYKFIEHYEELNIAVLEDLDYKEVASNEAEPNA